MDENLAANSVRGRQILLSIARCWLTAGCVLTASHALAQSVVFINPGKTDEAYWVASADVMRKAADSLGMHLEVIYTERDRLKPIEVAHHLAKLPKAQRPDYVIFSNEYSVAPSLLRALDGSGIRAFMAFSGVHDQLREQVGKPRERFHGWIGSMESNAEEAGYLTASALIAKARQSMNARGASEKMHMVAIAGDRSTPSSIARNAGMRRAIEGAQDVVLEQEVYGEWRREKAQEQAKVLFRRYPQVRLVWAGSDQMAFGAMQAWSAQGGTPGKNAFFSGINTSDEAFRALENGSLSALAGGHFLVGAWSMVVIFDYHQKIDFVSEGVELKENTFILFNPSNLKEFQRRFSLESSHLDFKKFSKFYNRNIQKYDFDLNKLLR